MSKIPAAIILIFIACSASGEGPTTRPAASPTEADSLAAASLVYRAEHVSLFASAADRITRVWASLRFAQRLDGENPDINRLLADIYQSKGDLQKEADALSAYLAERPGDYYMSLRWLLLRRDLLNTAEKRIEFFQSVSKAESCPTALKAEALAETAIRLAGQGYRDKAFETLDNALRLDRYNFTALRMRLNMLAKPTAADEAELLFASLANNPSDTQTAITLADMLQSQGLHEQAISLFEHARQMAGANNEGLALTAAVGLADALLDAGNAQQAVAVLEPARGTNPNDHELAFKLVEAYRAMGQNAKADQLVADLTAMFRKEREKVLVSPPFARALIWFYLAVNPNPGVALAYARQTREAGWGSDAATQRNILMLLGAAEIKSGNVKAGEGRLWEIAGGDIFAAAFLAEHWYAAGNDADANKALLAGLSLGRGGWAYRRLRAIAQERKVEIPPFKGADEVLKKAQQFEMDLLIPARSPERFVAVRLEPVRRRVALGVPVEIRATLTNIGNVRVPLGAEGVVTPAFAPQVMLISEKVIFSELPVSWWPAPRYLMPGQSISVQVRLDKGKLARALCLRPLDDIELSVTGLLSPTVRRGEMLSSAPAIQIDPVTITRLGILSRVRPEKLQDLPAAYEEALGWIVRDIKRGTLPDRMRAARQVASLLAWSRRVETGDVKLPESLSGKVSRPVALSMLMEVLKDTSPVVRAEMLAALEDVRLEDDILKCLGPVIDDTSTLVRMRAVELIGASETSGKETIITYLAQDKDELVRLMASAFIKTE